MIKASLEDITIKITDGKHGDCTPEENSGFFFVSCKDVNNGKIDYSNSRQITKDDFIEAHKRTMLEPDDILITNSGTIGRMALVKDIPETYRTTFQKSVAIVKPDKKKILPVYLYYRLQYCVSEFINCSNGSAQKNLLLGTMRNFKLDYPQSMEKQRRISNILSSYDDLIENNQKQIKLLEEAAQRLYKEWFVDLRFPGHENVKIIDGVPEGWKVGRADNYFDITIGKTPPRSEKQFFVNGNVGVPWVSIADMGNSETYIFKTSEGLTHDAIEKHNVKVVPEGTILVSFKLTLGRVSITTKEMCTNEAIAHFRINEPALREYTYSYLKYFKYDTLGNTSSISKAVNSKIIKGMPFVMPNGGIVQLYSKIVSPIFNLIHDKQALIVRLSEARDRLLPKLMSGEIEL